MLFLDWWIQPPYLKKKKIYILLLLIPKWAHETRYNGGERIQNEKNTGDET